MNIQKLCTTVFFSMVVLGSLAPTHMLLIRIGPCGDGQVTIINVTEFSIKTNTYDSTLSGTVNISDDIENGWRVKATMQKCQDIRNTETCDYFKSYDLLKNGCGDEEDDESDLYLMMFHYTDPRLSCPLKAGNYKIIQYPVFTEDNHLAVHESKISTSVFGYTYKLEGYVRERKIFCTEAYLQLLYRRDHNWITGKTKSNKSPQRTKTIET